ncbi:hypothetical protein FGO68_gene12669 [Halteria grandinella]|uniref:Uncharacterized protein n=1 Tax=Halteria grandinella TaxID=5974 RepID=A0A8J8NYN7_HALGN|nr:hypothetical protein FGO68_gene12669 [Halteria grandinella]
MMTKIFMKLRGKLLAQDQFLLIRYLKPVRIHLNMMLKSRYHDCTQVKCRPECLGQAIFLFEIVPQQEAQNYENNGRDDTTPVLQVQMGLKVDSQKTYDDSNVKSEIHDLNLALPLVVLEFVLLIGQEGEVIVIDFALTFSGMLRDVIQADFISNIIQKFVLFFRQGRAPAVLLWGA